MKTIGAGGSRDFPVHTTKQMNRHDYMKSNIIVQKNDTICGFPETFVLYADT